VDNFELLYDRYARALFHYAQEEKLLDSVMHELMLCDQAWVADTVLRKFFTHPLITKDEKKLIAKALAKKGIFSELMVRLFEVLIDNKRELLIHGICKRFRELYELSRHTTQVHLETAQPLSSRQTKALQNVLSERLQSTVALEVRQKKELLSGFSLRYRDMLYDASLRGQLRQLREVIA
jgi:F-type H+-transporting ATPase subunit delta